LRDLHIHSASVPTILCDNLSATYLSANPIFHARAKYIEVDYHFVRDRVAKKEIQIHFISSHDQLTDVLTKPLPTTPFIGIVATQFFTHVFDKFTEKTKNSKKQ